ncbi:hypothetical protein [Blastococcus sp. TBT05-19]|uniref:hypothetical protein n=1 Tax=Blastococcus sp. TBT05-19 TaxID=2250581 RepID=UPI0011BF8565|nr:hypothetical protein [Blastococcus sp. TBT05-19]
MTNARIGQELGLSTPVAVLYLGMVAALYAGHAVGLALLVVFGPTTSGRSSVLVPVVALSLLVACSLVLALVSRQLRPGTNLLLHPLRALALLYGSAVPVAWRSLRPFPAGADAGPDGG